MTHRIFVACIMLLLPVVAGCNGSEQPGQPATNRSAPGSSHDRRKPVAANSPTTTSAKPQVESEIGGLAARRKNLRPGLTRKEAAPQEYEDEVLPSGVKEVEYKSGGLALKAWLKVPADQTRRYPALVFAHGGFSFSGADFEAVSAWVDSGWVVLTPMLRGENGLPGHYDLFLGEVDDLIAAGEYVATLPYVHPRGVFAMGHSVGGTRCMLAAMLPGPFAAAASIGGGPDFREWIKGQPELAPFDLSDTEQVAARNPIENIASLRIPLYVLHGDKEWWCEEASRKFVAQAKEARKLVQHLTPPGDHFTCFERASDLAKQRFDARARNLR